MPLRSDATTWWGVALDSPNPRALAEFYARLLGWRLFGDDQDAAVAPSEDAGYDIAFQYEPDYVRPVWPPVEGHQQMSMHLDLQVDDLRSAVAFAVEAGAELAGHQPQEDVRVMLDPDGHPFCLYLDA